MENMLYILGTAIEILVAAVEVMAVEEETLGFLLVLGEFYINFWE